MTAPREQTGKGQMNFNQGATYEGEWLNNRMHGEGTYTWPDNRRCVLPMVWERSALSLGGSRCPTVRSQDD